MERKRKILRNRIKCKECGEIIESKYTHDWQCCKCFKTSNGEHGVYIDGGMSYLSRGGNIDGYEDLSESRPYTDEERDEYNEKQLRMAKHFGSWFTVDLME